MTSCFARTLLASIVVGAGCGSPAPPTPSASAEAPPAAAIPEAEVILVVDGRPVPLAAFEAYLAANFDTEGLEEPLTPEDDAVVRSRLFDDFAGEETMLAEAVARGIRVGEAEVRSWLSGELPEDDPVRAAARTERARRELTLRKLLDALVLEQPGSDEVSIRRKVAERHRVERRPDRLPFGYRPESP